MKQKMKLAVFVEFFPPNLGSDRRIYEIMRRLAVKHDIHFIVMPPFRKLSGSRNPEKKRDDPHFCGEEKQVLHKGIYAHYVPIPSFLANLWRKSHALAYLLTLIALSIKAHNVTRKVNPHMVVLNYPSPYTGILGFIEGKVLRRPVVLDFSDLIAQYSIALLNLKENGLKAKFLIVIQDFIARNSSKVVATNSLIRKYALDLGVSANRISVIPNGVDTEFFSPKVNDKDIRSELGLSAKSICLYAGRLEGWAGIDIILKLCNKFKDKNSDVQFLVVGGKLHKKRCLRNLVVVEETPYEKIPNILNIADFILVPFPRNIVSHATTPLKLLEAMSMMKPVIASRVQSIEEIIIDNQNGILVDEPDNVTEWFEALESVKNSRAYAEKIAFEARRTVVEKYDWSYLAEEYERYLFAGTPNLQSGE
jgi:glycosyltransferase involved in cell wall biosynthesis